MGNTTKLPEGWGLKDDNIHWWEEYLPDSTIISKEDVNQLRGLDMPIKTIKKNTKIKITDIFKFMVFFDYENEDGEIGIIDSSDIYKFYNTKDSKKIIRKQKLDKLNDK